MHARTRRAARLATAKLLLDPEAMMRLRPIEVDFARAHGLEGPFHAERANVDVREDRRDEQDTDRSVQDLRPLHHTDREPTVEREHKNVAGDRHGEAAEHYHPEHHLLAGIEAARRRMPIADDTAALFDPLDVDPLRDIVLYPEDEHQEHAEREREAQIVVGVLGGEREVGKGFGTN